VLALSGLHLGILYMLLSWLTFSHRRRHVISQLILVISVWAFAFLVGLPVSIVRSATMISLFAIFTISYRPHLSVNLLSLTALLILTIDCSALFDIGFQLSFLSVLSILLLMPLTQKERPFTWQMMRQPPRKHKVVATLRDMLFISIAAQIGTAPLVAYYFGRFATYFLLTNLIVIPAAYLILCGTIVMLILPSCSGIILLAVGALNYLLTQITRLPMASLEGLHPSVTQVFLYYVVVLSLTCILATVRYRSGSPRS
jgi:competence protein ComEC